MPAPQPLNQVAGFERAIMLERQREGIAKANAEGKYKDRKPTARAEVEEARKFQAEGLGATEIAKRLRVSGASVYRMLEDTTS